MNPNNTPQNSPVAPGSSEQRLTPQQALSNLEQASQPNFDHSHAMAGWVTVESLKVLKGVVDMFEILTQRPPEPDKEPNEPKPTQEESCPASSSAEPTEPEDPTEPADPTAAG